jgi:hypothetical protein
MGIRGVAVINYVAWFWALFPDARCFISGREGMEGRKR